MAGLKCTRTEELLVRTRSSSSKFCTRSSSAVLSTYRRACRASLLTSSRDCTIPSGSDRIHVFTRVRAVRRASVAGVWRRDGSERRTVACLRLNEQKQSAFSTRLWKTQPFELVMHLRHLEITAMNEELVVRARSSSGT
eukprot:3465115-Pleurochrysis_carterae.AAC.1